MSADTLAAASVAPDADLTAGQETGLRGELKAAATRAVAEHSTALLSLSHRIADHPEEGLREERAAAWVAESVRDLSGVTSEHGLAGMATALRARHGTGTREVVLCAEYDALPVIGHGCGHNVIAAAAVGAFAALVPLAERLDLTLTLLGTPAEETVGGKLRLLRAGAFDTAHAAMMIHPAPVDQVSMNPFACAEMRIRFTGRESHASLAPHRGINAQDALTVTLTALGLARQHLEPNQQFHSAISEAGGAPNVIPGSAALHVLARAGDLESLERVRAVVTRCAQAGALAAGCEVDVVSARDEDTAHIRMDEAMLASFRANALQLGRDPAPVGGFGGSTDMGNVSLAVPSIHPMIGLGDASLSLHTREFGDAARGPGGDRAVLDGATLLAHTAIDVSLLP